MTELEQIAASVAKALGLEAVSNTYGPITCHGWDDSVGSIYLQIDGSNLFSTHWQVRCRDWLLEQGYCIAFEDRKDCTHDLWLNKDVDSKTISIFCPASEFAARAIHALMKEKP